jgi:hypothetical protein
VLVVSHAGSLWKEECLVIEDIPMNAPGFKGNGAGQTSGFAGASAVYIPDSYLHEATKEVAPKAVKSLIKRYLGSERGLHNIPDDKRREFLDDLSLLAELPPMYAIEATLFPDERAQSKTEWRGSLGELVGKIRQTSETSKGELPFLKLAVFGDKRSDKNCLRHMGNQRQITGAVGDYDAGKISFAEAEERVRKAGSQRCCTRQPAIPPTSRAGGSWRRHRDAATIRSTRSLWTG